MASGRSLVIRSLATIACIASYSGFHGVKAETIIDEWASVQAPPLPR